MTILLLDWSHNSGLVDTYYWLRIFSFVVDIVAFWVLCYKFVYNNFTGRSHDLNWLACGIWAGTFVWAVGLAEIVFDQPDLSGGIRVLLTPFCVLFWAWLAIWKVPIATDLKETKFEQDVRELEGE